MKVLLLVRQNSSGIWEYAQSLVAPLRELGHEAVLEDASTWIPNETGPKFDKSVTERLRTVAADCEIVHAFGYRAAWAAAEAFGPREAWVYSAYDMPRSTHRFLMSRLNDSQGGICASRAVYRVLDESLGMNLHVIAPGIPNIEAHVRSKSDCREALSLAPHGLVVGAMGRFVEEKAFDTLIDAFPRVLEKIPDARLVISGAGPEEHALKERAHAVDNLGRIQILPWRADLEPFFGAIDLFVAPYQNAGFSLSVLHAMARSVPVLVRFSGGLYEIVDPDISGFIFKDQAELESQLCEVLDLPLTLETVGNGGRIRVLERFSIERSARLVSEIYELAVCP